MGGLRSEPSIDASQRQVRLIVVGEAIGKGESFSLGDSTRKIGPSSNGFGKFTT